MWSETSRYSAYRYNDLFFYKIGNMPLAQIRRKDILNILDPLINRK
ncbi:hypothetical protein [Campylobacter sp.]|nr:hypothetical protein [Campylobacter sp.]MDY4012666.1 hypothetical protein [Campylobacter sp.]